jgi:hypothetical protein
MTKRRKKRPRDSNTFLGADLPKGLGFTLMVLLLVPAALLVMKAQASDRLLLPLTLLALFAGLFVEFRRITRRWTTVFWTALVALGLSYFAFLPGKHERIYHVDAHIQLWPYFFCGFFLLIAIIEHRKLVTPRLHEGMTLLQTVALAYWTLEAIDLQAIGPWTIALLTMMVLFGLYVVGHAFLPITLSHPHRLLLSLWSSIIMLFLAVDNIRRVYAMGYIEETEDPLAIGLIVANHFLLGISSVYMAQNTMMLFGFLPGKGTFFNARYFKETRALIADHIDRYADNQVPFGLALFSLVYAAGLFALNHHYGLVRSNVAIWAVFVSFPPLAWLVDMALGPRR